MAALPFWLGEADESGEDTVGEALPLALLGVLFSAGSVGEGLRIGSDDWSGFGVGFSMFSAGRESVLGKVVLPDRSKTPKSNGIHEEKVTFLMCHPTDIHNLLHIERLDAGHLCW